jgi:heme/copper-type cytochrome/quinol oxidase subunit 2
MENDTKKPIGYRSSALLGFIIMFSIIFLIFIILSIVLAFNESPDHGSKLELIITYIVIIGFIFVPILTYYLYVYFHTPKIAIYIDETKLYLVNLKLEIELSNIYLVHREYILAKDMKRNTFGNLVIALETGDYITVKWLNEIDALVNLINDRLNK